MDRCTGHCDLTEAMLKRALNTIQLIKQSDKYTLHVKLENEKPRIVFAEQKKKTIA